MAAYDPHAWLEFGVAAAGAAAVLAGLVFVAVSINLEKVLEIRGLPGRAGETIVMFMGALIASLLLLVPGQSRTALGAELAATGIVLAVVLILISGPGLKHQAHHPLSWRITRIVSALVTSVPIAVAGICLLAKSGGGLYWLLAAVTLAFIAGIGNAWVLLGRDRSGRALPGHYRPGSFVGLPAATDRRALSTRRSSSKRRPLAPAARLRHLSRSAPTNRHDPTMPATHAPNVSAWSGSSSTCMLSSWPLRGQNRSTSRRQARS